MNPYIGLVNQKLLFAGLLLQQAGEKPLASGAQLQEALNQSVLFQLTSGYQLHLKEIANNYQCPDAEGISSARLLVKTLAAMDKAPAEATEMLDLVTDGQSWLSRMLAALELMSQLPGNKPSGGEIPLKQLDTTVVEKPNRESLQSWLRQLRELVERHRDLMYEC